MGMFPAKWSTKFKGSSLVVEDAGTLARNSGFFSMSTVGQSICSEMPIPRTGRYWIEVQFDRDCTVAGEGLGYCYMMGLLAANLAEHSEIFNRPCGLASSSCGFWGVDDSGIAGWSGMGIRHGFGGWQGAPESARIANGGRIFLSGDRIAILVDRDRATASFFRNGIPIPGLIFDGLPMFSDLYVGVTLFHLGSSARLVSSVSEDARGG